jgi:hypothetical protein
MNLNPKKCLRNQEGPADQLSKVKKGTQTSFSSALRTTTLRSLTILITLWHQQSKKNLGLQSIKRMRTQFQSQKSCSVNMGLLEFYQ